MSNEENKVPAGQSSSWSSFLKSVSSFNGDLASLTAPPFILSPVSLVEYSKFWLCNIDTFRYPALEVDGGTEARFLGVLKWFIGTLRAQYASRNEKMGSEKKPLNPFLGEVFTGKWTGEDGNDIVLVSEQVSHHPPVTGYAIFDDSTKTLLYGSNEIKAKISMGLTLSVKQKGHATFELQGIKTADGRPETYIVTLPALHIEGIMTGAPYVELEGKSYVVSNTGYKAVVEFSGKGYFSGKKNSFKAAVYNLAVEDEKLQKQYKVHGQWSSGVCKIKDEHTGTETEFLDTMAVEPEPLEVKPVEQQHELESRRAWSKVAEAIHKGDYDLISHEKSKIENEQREMRKREQEEGRQWQTRWFKQPTEEAQKLYEDICNKAGITPETTGWEFSRELYNDGEIKP